jgi:hypothetical protein
MAIGVNQTGVGGPRGIIGCIDPLASNYNPLADTPCGPVGQPTPDLFGTYTSGCCNYPASNLTGCMDPQANNYDPVAVQACNGCCTYGQPTGGGTGIGVLPDDKEDGIVVIPTGGGTGSGTDNVTTYCSSLLFNISSNGIVTASNSALKEECCKEEFVGEPVFWDGVNCNIYSDTGADSLCESFSLGLISQAEFNSRVICIDCNNFAWWDNLYTTINGDSLQDVDNDLWNFLIDIITSNGEGDLFVNGSFYVDALNGEPIVGQECCSRLPNSNYQVVTNDFGDEVSACLCNVTPEISVKCSCLTTVDEFIALAASIQGRELLLNMSTLMSLGLTGEESQFVIDNLFNPSDFGGDGIPDNVNARILVSNALYIRGGFYVCYRSFNIGGSTSGTISLTNSNITIPVETTVQKCLEIGGFYDGVLCYCKPLGECNLSLQDLTTTTTTDNFNQTVTYVTFNGESIDETCCLKIASENNLPWVYKEYQGELNCYTRDPSPCLPLKFKLNSELIKPICDVPLSVGASFYFGVPENSCVEVVDEGDDVIDVDNGTEPCLLTFDGDNNLVDYNSAHTVPKTPILNNLDINLDELISNREPCCFNPLTPIEASLVITDSKNNILQTSDSIVFNELETWFDLGTVFDTTTITATTATTEGYNVALQFTSGLNCCCTYDIFIDNIKFECLSANTVTDVIKNKCPGFDIAPVIDNKKSWVYNPGLLDYSQRRDQAGELIDNKIVQAGEFGLIEGYGVINRTFAPSVDASLPWRYTDYFNQSSVLEKHSDLVLNSKELYMTFDMCSECCLEYKPCPNGYTLSAGTDICYKYVVSKQFQDGQNFEFQDGESYDFMDF